MINGGRVPAVRVPAESAHRAQARSQNGVVQYILWHSDQGRSLGRTSKGAAASPIPSNVGIASSISPYQLRHTPSGTPRLAELGILAIFAKESRIDDMSTMNVSLPDDLKSFVAAQVSEGGYGSTSEYVRDLIRRDHDRRQLRAALLEGARSPATTTADAAYFASLRDQARAGD